MRCMAWPGVRPVVLEGLGRALERESSPTNRSLHTCAIAFPPQQAPTHSMTIGNCIVGLAHITPPSPTSPPPNRCQQPGEASYELYRKEKSDILGSLKRRAELLVRAGQEDGGGARRRARKRSAAEGCWDGEDRGSQG